MSRFIYFHFVSAACGQNGDEMLSLGVSRQVANICYYFYRFLSFAFCARRFQFAGRCGNRTAKLDFEARRTRLPRRTRGMAMPVCIIYYLIDIHCSNFNIQVFGCTGFTVCVLAFELTVIRFEVLPAPFSVFLHCRLIRQGITKLSQSAHLFCDFFPVRGEACFSGVGIIGFQSH